jgi:Immunity protein 50
MTWIKYVGNKQSVESIFSKAPSLAEVRLHEIRLHQDGPRISLRLDLNEFPDNPPPKWVVGKFNRAQLTLVLIDINDFQMNGWNRNNIGELILEGRDEGIKLKFVGQFLRIDCFAQFLEVEKISGYCDSEATMT